MRLRNYPKGSRILSLHYVEDCVQAEHNIIQALKSSPRFIQKREYGSEYFEGSFAELSRMVSSYCLATDEQGQSTSGITYQCPRCNYETDQKNKNGPCPNIENNVEFTDDIKSAVLDNVYKIIPENHLQTPPIIHVYQNVQAPSPVFVLYDPFSTFEKIQMLDKYFMIQRENRLTSHKLNLIRSRKMKSMYDSYDFFANTKRYRAMNEKDLMNEASHHMMAHKVGCADPSKKTLVANLIAISDHYHFMVYFVDKYGEWKRVHLKEFVQEVVSQFSVFATLNEKFLAKFLYYTQYVGDPLLCRKAETLLIELYSFIICMHWIPRTKDMTYIELLDTMIYDTVSHPDFEYLPGREMIGQHCDKLYHDAMARTPTDKRECVYNTVMTNLEDLAVKCFAGKIADIQSLFEEKSKDVQFRYIIDDHYKQKQADKDIDLFTIDNPDFVDNEDIEPLPLSDKEKSVLGIYV